MTGQRRSKVAPRRAWNSITGLLLHSRALHSTLVTMEHQENCERLRNEMPRVRSPRRRSMGGSAVLRAAPVAKPLAKPLVFRKTKRELEREQQQAREKLERMKSKKHHIEQVKTRGGGKLRHARPKCARVLEWTCRRTSRYFHSRREFDAGALRTQPRRRLLF